MNPRPLVFAALVFAVSSFSLEAQSPTDFGETIEVRIINVDVVVTDRSGHRIQGLTKDDFDIFQNGRKQQTTNFFEFHDSAEPAVSGDGAVVYADSGGDQFDGVPARLRDRKWIIFLDELSLGPFHRNKLLKNLRSFLQKGMRPRDEVMLVTWNNAVEVQCPLTRDRGVLEQALNRVSMSVSDTGSRRRLRSQTEQRLKDLVTESERKGAKPAYGIALGEVRAYANQVDSDVKRTVSALNSVITALGGTEGRKILIFGSESLPSVPGIEMFHFLDAVKGKFDGGDLHQPISEGMVYEATGTLQTIASNANAHDVTLYAVDPGGMSFDTEGIEEHGTADIDFAAGARMSQRIGTSNGQTALATVAEATGGRASVASNDLDAIFTTIREDLGSYYSLGYSGSGARQDRERRVHVRVKNPAYRVRTRASLFEKSLETEVREALVSNLMFPSSRNDLGLVVRSGAVMKGRGNRDLVVPLQLLIPRDHLALLPSAGSLNGNFTVYVAFERRNGAISRVVRSPQQFRMPLTSTSSHVGFNIPTTVDSQTEKISIAVVDEISKTTGYVMVRVN